MFDNILLAADGSDHAREAAKVAGDLARLSGGTLRVVTAFERLSRYLGEPNLSQAIAERMEKADKILSDAIERVGEIPGNCETEALEGDPAETILRVAETYDVDLIIMGTRGMGDMRSLILGSQSHKVVSAASCPVMLVR